MTDGETLSSAQALAIASRESIVLGPAYSIALIDVGELVKMTLTCSVGGVVHERSLAIGTRRSYYGFSELARSFWLIMRSELEHVRKQAKQG